MSDETNNDTGQPTPPDPQQPGGAGGAVPPGYVNPAGMFPPMFAPWMGQQQLNLDSHCIENAVPARVRAAFTFATYMGRRIQPLVSYTEQGHMEVEPAPDLTATEEEAFHAACDTLTLYFLGKLPPDTLEAKRHEANAIELYKRRPGQVIKCLNCGGAKQRKSAAGRVSVCALCEGAGSVLVIPAKHDRKTGQEGGGQ